VIADILTLAQKELKEIVLARSAGRLNARGGWLNLLLIMGVFGIFLPYQNGPAWIDSPGTLFLWAWVPLLLVSSVTTDSFAGERERHTLETLLASRLSDRSILLGKVAAAILYGWGLTLLSVVLGVITINVGYWNGTLRFYPLDFVLAGILLGLLGAGLAATAGVLVSLRSGSVRQAAQTMNLAIMVLLFVPIFGLQALPAETKAAVFGVLQTASLNQILLGVIGLLVVLDLALLAAALARFQRARLILD
jgi:ABC-2 type transport system permease protein